MSGLIKRIDLAPIGFLLLVVFNGTGDDTRPTTRTAIQVKYKTLLVFLLYSHSFTFFRAALIGSPRRGVPPAAKPHLIRPQIQT